MRRLFILLFFIPLIGVCSLSNGAFAQTAQQVVPGYATSNGCSPSQPTCFRQSAPSQSALDIAAATNLKASAGTVGTICLNTAGSAASSIIDSASTTVTAADTILTIPSTATAGTCWTLDWPTVTGLSVVPGTGAVLSATFN